MLKYNTSKMNNFDRVLISSINDRKTRVEVYKEDAYMEQFAIRTKNYGRLCKIVGRKELQVKHCFDIEAKGEDFDFYTFDNIYQDIKQIYHAEVFDGGKDSRVEEDFRKKKIMKHSERFNLKPEYCTLIFPKYSNQHI